MNFLFSKAMKSYKQNFKSITLIGLLVYLPIQVILALVPPQYDPTVIMLEILEGRAMNYSKLFAYFGIILLISILFTPLAQAAATCIALNEKPSLALILDFSFMKWGRLIVTALMVNLLIVLFSVLIIPPLYFNTVLAFSSHLVATQDCFGIQALRSSMSLVKGRFFKIFGFVLFIGFLDLVVGSSVINAFVSIFPMANKAGIVNPFFLVLSGTAANIIGFYFQVVLAFRFLELRMKS